MNFIQTDSLRLVLLAGCFKGYRSQPAKGPRDVLELRCGAEAI